MAASGSSRSIRNPQFFLLQQDIRGACAKALATKDYSYIAINPKLNARPHPMWSKIAVLLQTWEGAKTQRAEGSLAPGVEVMAPIFDGMIIRSLDLSRGELLSRLNTLSHIRWSLVPFKTQCRWRIAASKPCANTESLTTRCTRCLRTRRLWTRSACPVA